MIPGEPAIWIHHYPSPEGTYCYYETNYGYVYAITYGGWWYAYLTAGVRTRPLSLGTFVYASVAKAAVTRRYRSGRFLI